VFIGHFAVAFAAKKAAPRVSLGTLVLAAAFLDIVWPVLVLLGIERFRIVPGFTAINPFDFTYYPWSHSLLMTLAWSLAFALVYLAASRDRAGAAWLGLVVASHWLLDFVSHRADMPLAPGIGAKFGLDLWNHVAATAAVEVAMLAAGVALYVSVTKPATRAGSWGFWSFLALLAFLYAGAVRGTPPPNITMLALTALSGWLAVWWAAWFDRNRVAR